MSVKPLHERAFQEHILEYLFAEEGGGCMLHNPRYDFNDAVIPLGVAYWTRLVERFLQAE